MESAPRTRLHGKRMILEGSISLHAKARLLGSTFHLDHMQDLCSMRLHKARWRAVINDKSVVDNCLSASICHFIRLDISNTATASYDSPTKSHCHHFQFSNSLLSFQPISAKIPPCCFSELVPRATSGFKMVGGKTGPPEAVYTEVTGLNNVYACARCHGSRWRQQPGHHKNLEKFPSTNRVMTSSNRLRRPCRVSPARVRLICSKPTHWALHVPKEQ